MIFNPVKVPTPDQLKNHDRNLEVAVYALWERSGQWVDRPIDYLVASLTSYQETNPDHPIFSKELSFKNVAEIPEDYKCCGTHSCLSPPS